MTSDLNDVVGASTLRVDLGDARELEILIQVNRPAESEDGAGFSCLYRLRGLQCGSFVRVARGADSLDALRASIGCIEIILNTLPQQYQIPPQAIFEAPPARAGFRGIAEIHQGLAGYRSLDFERALKLLLPYAELGIAELQLIVGDSLRLSPVSPGMPEAEKWLTLAAQQGNGQAWFILAELLPDDPEGNGLRRDYLRRAQECGFALAGAE
jgi:hypothetical protein